jgi:hypothetical protein
MKHLKILGIMLIAYTLNGCDFLKATNQNPAADLTKLPPETQEGKNTFGCLVNGKVWRNQGFVNIYSSNLIVSKTESLTIAATKVTQETTQGINISAIVNDLGIYRLNEINSAIFLDAKKSCIKTGYKPIEGTLMITKYQYTEINGGRRLIIAGKFNFVTLMQPCGDTIRVTDGRFDILL